MTVKQMASGRMVDLLNLTAEQVDFKRDVAPALARICRYDGAMECAPYTVAQHCVQMADHVLENTSDANLARACLLHDCHEAYCGDITTPTARALEKCAPQGTQNDSIKKSIENLKTRLDAPIFAAAGMPELSQEISSALKTMDAAMLETERVHMLCPPSQPWEPNIEHMLLKMRGAIRPWSVMDAETTWLERFATLCPNAWEAPHWRDMN